MATKISLTEQDLRRFAKKFRNRAGKTRAEAARELGVSQTTIFNAEENKGQSLRKVRIRMIEKYSSLKVRGPIFMLES